MSAAIGITQTSLVGLLATNPTLVATVIRMRGERASWQKIATATKRHPASVRDIGLAVGLPLNMPGAHAYGGTRKDWERKRLEAEAAPAPTDRRRGPLPPGHPETWGAISQQPWPGIAL